MIYFRVLWRESQESIYGADTDRQRANNKVCQADQYTYCTLDEIQLARSDKYSVKIRKYSFQKQRNMAKNQEAGKGSSI